MKYGLIESLKYKIILIFLIATLLNGCASNNTNDYSFQEVVGEVSLKDTCQSIRNQLNDKDLVNIASIIDNDQIVQKVFFGVKSNSEEFKTFRLAIEAVLDKPEQYLNQYVESVDAWDYFRFEESGDMATCALRNRLIDDGLVILEFELVIKNNKVRIINWYDHVAGLYFTNALRAVVIDIHKALELLETEDASDKVFAEFDYKKLKTLLSGIRAGDFDVIDAAYKELPSKYKSNSIYGIRHIQAAITVDKESYINAAEQFIKKFGNRPQQGLLLLDYFHEKNMKKEFLEVFENAEGRLGEDAAFFTLKARIYENNSDLKKYYSLMLKAINNDSSFSSGYWVLVKHFAEKENFEDCVLVLDVLEKVFSYKFDRETFRGYEEYEKLSQSAIYIDWIDKKSKG